MLHIPLTLQGPISDAGQGWLVSQPRHWSWVGGYTREEALIKGVAQDVIHECTQRREREWYEGDKHIAIMAMTEVLCITWFSIRTYNHTLGWLQWVGCYGT